MTTVTSLPFWSSTLRSSASAYFVPSWKTWPISMPRAGVTGADLGGLDGAVGREVAAGDEVDDVLAGDVGAGDPAAALGDPGVEQVADAGRALEPERTRADVALDERRVGREVGLGEG